MQAIDMKLLHLLKALVVKAHNKPIQTHLQKFQPIFYTFFAV